MLFILVGFVALLALVLLVSFSDLYHAVQRGRQIRAMEEIKLLAREVEQYSKKHGSAYPLEGEKGDRGWQIVPVNQLPAFTVGAEKRVSLATTDPWGHPYLYAYNSELRSYSIISTGRDGRLDNDNKPSESGGIQCYESDITWRDGSFTQYPEAILRKYM